jgi:hypothetical protein
MNYRLIRVPALALLTAGVVAAASLARAGEQRQVAHRPITANWCGDGCDVVTTDWSLAAFQVIKAADGYQDPMAASRSLAMMHLAMHDAVNTVRPHYERYALTAAPASSDKADAAVAAATAAHDVLAALYPQEPARALLRAELEKAMLDAGIGAAIEAGTRLGKAAAAAVLEKRTGDGSACCTTPSRKRPPRCREGRIAELRRKGVHPDYAPAC